MSGFHRPRSAVGSIRATAVGAARAAVFLAMMLGAFSAVLLPASAQPVPTAVAAAVEGQPRVIALSSELELDDFVEVTVEGLADWARGAGNTPWQLVPFINGRALRGSYPVAVDLGRGKLQFHLTMTPQTRSAWTQLLSPPALKRQVAFSVGPELQDPFATDFSKDRSPATLVVVELGWMLVAALLTLAFAVAFVALSVRTSILRERVIGGRRSLHLEATSRFSLGKVQLALWFFIVFTAFITIWLATGNYDTINSSTVAMMGISAGTAVGDAYIRSGALGRPRRVRDLAAVDADPPAWSSRLIDGESDGKRKAWQGFQAFFRDLLSDRDGYSIFRFQMLAWTVVLNIVFVSHVYYDLAIPEFRPDLLYLMGLSSGTYIAYRYPETKREAEYAGDARREEAASRREAEAE